MDEERAEEQQAPEQTPEQVAAEQVAEQQVPEQQAPEQQAPEQRAAEHVAEPPPAATPEPGTPPPGPAVLPQLSAEAIVDGLEREGLRWSRDSDGDLHLFVEGSLFYLLRLGAHGQVLHVRGRWHRSLPATLAEEAARFCLEWNRDYIFPKAYITIDDRGRVHLAGEVSTDLSAGVAPEQLVHLLRCAFGTTCQAFDEADARFPDTTVSTYPKVD